MFHIPPVVCVSWGPRSWRYVSHTDLPLHNRGEDVYKDSREYQDDLPSYNRDEDLYVVRGGQGLQRHRGMSQMES